MIRHCTNTVIAEMTLALRLLLLVTVALIPACKSDNDVATSATTGSALPATVQLTKVKISDYVVVSTQRVGRTVMAYRMRAVAENTGADRYTNVTATLISAPPNITIVDGNVAFGTVTANSSTTSADEFVIEVDLTVLTTLDDLLWQVNGTVSGSGGGSGGGTPSTAGIFMSIDDNVIKGGSDTDSHKDWIEITAFMEGSSFQVGDTVGSSRPTGQLELDGVTVYKDMDISSPALRQALAGGDIFTEVKIDVIRTCDNSAYTQYAITLTVSALTGLSLNAGSDGVPGEMLTFDYSRIETMYTPVGPGCKFETPVYSYQDALKL